MSGIGASAVDNPLAFITATGLISFARSFSAGTISGFFGFCIVSIFGFTGSILGFSGVYAGIIGSLGCAGLIFPLKAS